MYEELVKRLKRYVEIERAEGHGADLEAEAADAIETLVGKVAYLIERCGKADKNCADATRLGALWKEAALEQSPRWIPVTEKLPEKYHQVLVYGLNGMQIDYYAGEKSIGGRPLFMISEAKVTHWQPLPEPPKEET